MFLPLYLFRVISWSKWFSQDTQYFYLSRLCTGPFLICLVNMKGTKHKHDESHFVERGVTLRYKRIQMRLLIIMRSLMMFLVRVFVFLKVVRVKKGYRLLQMTKAKPSVGARHSRETTA